VPRRLRLDTELVRRGLARSREHAGELIAQGRVSVGSMRASKAATVVATDAAIEVVADPSRPDYVSRGGHKLAGALARFRPDGLVVSGRIALDAGASTGGFTDVLLREGAARVTAVDVGYGQLAWPLRQHRAVTVVDRVNVRDLRPDLLPYRPELVVGDLSFISLRLVLGPLVAIAEPDADFVMLVKPQFEVGRAHLGPGGVVRDPRLRVDSVLAVAAAARSHDLGVLGVCASPLPGPAGNVEYFTWLRHGAPDIVSSEVEAVVSEGPQ
jgi:23S rRNA (cytidine1920-2'-O)/16S rRNA (cytidine1409-2'-O)-methyltransferase